MDHAPVISTDSPSVVGVVSVSVVGTVSATGPLAHGTVLNRWTGAEIGSNTNGDDDGRVYVGITATDLGTGMFHYEYAIHNRDNLRGIGKFTIRDRLIDRGQLLDAGVSARASKRSSDTD